MDKIMTIKVDSCFNCPFLNEWYCIHPKNVKKNYELVIFDNTTRTNFNYLKERHDNCPLPKNPCSIIAT